MSFSTFWKTSEYQTGIQLMASIWKLDTKKSLVFGCFGKWFSNHYRIKTCRHQSQCLDLHCIQQNDSACNFWWKGKTNILNCFQKTFILPVLFSDFGNQCNFELVQLLELPFIILVATKFTRMDNLLKYWSLLHLHLYKTTQNKSRFCICTKQPKTKVDFAFVQNNPKQK